MPRKSVEALVAPLAVGLVVLVALLGLIGTAIRDPKPHDLQVGLVGPDQAVAPLTGALVAKAPGTFDFTTYASEDEARAALDRRDIDGAVILGPSPRIIVSGAAGDTATTVITTVFSGALGAAGPVPVEVVHPFASGDAHGLILFFLILATLISTLVVQAVLLARGAAARAAAWIGVTAVWAAIAGVVSVLTADWIADGGYDQSALVGMIGLVALTSLAAGIFIAGSARLLGTAGIGLSALVVVLLDLIGSGGPAGSQILPDVYRWMSPYMPAGQLDSALRGTLYFGGEGVAMPVVVISAWLLAGFVLFMLGAAVRRRPAPAAELAPAH
jgi:hypothetical protein